MNFAFACPYYGPTQPIVGQTQRELIMKTEGKWVADLSTINQQHRQACEHIIRAAAASDADALFWTEHDVVCPPNAVNDLADTLDETGADIATGIAFRRCRPYQPMISQLRELTAEQYEEFVIGNGPAPLVNMARYYPLTEMGDFFLFSPSQIDTEAPPFPVDAASMCCLLLTRGAINRFAYVLDLFRAEEHSSIDVNFFRHVRRLGLKTYCDPSVLCGHLSDPYIIGWKDYSDEVEKLVSASSPTAPPLNP